MTKIAVNKCYGGFSVSKEAALKLREKGVKVVFKGEPYSDGSISDMDEKWGFRIHNEDFGIEHNNYYAWRADPRLIEVIEKLGSAKASGSLSAIEVVNIPDDVEWEIDEYDGIETVHEAHRSW
jgi:hypothetical protein